MSANLQNAQSIVLVGTHERLTAVLVSFLAQWVDRDEFLLQLNALVVKLLSLCRVNADRLSQVGQQHGKSLNAPYKNIERRGDKSMLKSMES